MTVDEIYSQMAQTFQTETGLALAGDGDMAVRLYAVAAQIYALYVQADWVARQAFPQTAEGEYLDLHAQLRSLERKEATRAVGTLRFTAGEASENDRAIPLGTVCMTAGLVRFETIQAAVLSAGATQVDVPAHPELRQPQSISGGQRRGERPGAAGAGDGHLPTPAQRGQCRLL